MLEPWKISVMVLTGLALWLAIQLLRSSAQRQTLKTEVARLRAQEKVLKAQAFFDSLTGLGNRLLLADRFTLTYERAKRSRKPFALMMIDLNNFKAVNDNYGHAAGDEVLICSARRLVETVRSSDTVTRLGGDEFVLVIETFDKTKDLVHLGRKLIAVLSEPIDLQQGVRVQVGASVGFGLYPEDGSTLNELLSMADRSMYDCKISGLMPLR